MVYLLHQLLTATAQRYPDRQALAFEGHQLTYGELESEANRFARLILDLGASRGARVGIHLRRSASSVIAAMGILKAGATYVPLDPMSPAARLGSITKTCGLSVVVTAAAGLNSLLAAVAVGSPVDRVIVMDGTSDEPPASPSLVDWTKTRQSLDSEPPTTRTIDGDTAYVLFTSGSTGTPKGVVISHLNALTFVNTAYEFFGIVKEDRLSHICALHSDMSVFDLFVAIKAGACVVGITEIDAMFPLRLAEAVAEGQISVWNSVPSALALLASVKDLERHDLSRLRLVLFAGESFPLKALRRLQGATPAARYCNMYGQTEANSSTYHWVDRIPDDSVAPIPIGRALPNFEVFVLDDNGRLVTEPGSEGELYVRSSTVAAGYWNQPDETARAFVENPLATVTRDRVYKTGDVVRIDASGEHVFVGRRDLMIKSRGYRVEIGEIEHVLSNHPGIISAVVYPIPDERVGNRLAAIVVPATNGALKREDIVAYCLGQLPRYMVPEEISFRDSLPLTASGKVDRAKLRAL